MYFLEVQFYDLPSVYAGLLAKVYTYLKQHDPGQPFCGVVLFGSRGFEPAALTPYQPLFDAGLIRRFFLDEIPELANAPLGLTILYLIRQSEGEAPALARQLVTRTKSEIQDAALRTDLLELIETVILYKLPELSREEIQAMLHLHDIRQSRVYQEAKAEGRQELLRELRETRVYKEIKAELVAEERQRILGLVSKLASLNLPVTKIAEVLELDEELVRQELAKS